MLSSLLNAPDVKLAIVSVSRDCFPIELARKRLAKLVTVCTMKNVPVIMCSVIIQNEKDVLIALDEVRAQGANAAVVYLGNFGPEGPETQFAALFGGPVMFCAAAEETAADLINGRGDAFCGLLNASVNLGLRKLNVFIPEEPVGLPEELANDVAHFAIVARIVIGVKKLKIISFGPRPQDFLACNAPIKQLYDLGVEVMENSELDLLQLYEAVAENDPEITGVIGEMLIELGREGNTYPDLLPKLARFELALTRFAEANKGICEYVVFADKCWPAFEKAFGFVPCYVNSRLAAKGMAVACEVDLYGALSEYIAYLASGAPSTLLDINNTVPADHPIKKLPDGVSRKDLFMGFHCGNTSVCNLQPGCSMKFQLIMNRLMEGGNAPDITRGTLEGTLKVSPITFMRLQGHAEGHLLAYIAQGETLPDDPMSFGGIGICAIPGFARFYRHVLVGMEFPHHAAMAFDHCGKAIWDALQLLGVRYIGVPLTTPRYPGENPFAG